MLNRRLLNGLIVGLCLVLSTGCDKGDSPSANDAGEAQAQHSYPTHQLPHIRTAELEAITIDGRLDESLWNELPSLHLRPMGDGSGFTTTVQVAYSDEALLLGAHLEDDHIWSTLQQRDDDLWTEEVLELFIAPDGAKTPYIELQINPLGTIFDAHFEAHRSNLSLARQWNLEGLDTAVFVAGTINDPTASDDFWSIEMLIPFAGMPFTDTAGDPLSPQRGDSWRVNIYRFDRPNESTTRAYGWSTAPRRDFHQVESFGFWTFDDP